MRKSVVNKIASWWQLRKGYYVTLDIRDSSVSFSKRLYKRLESEIFFEAENEELKDESLPPSPLRGTVHKQSSRGELQETKSQVNGSDKSNKSNGAIDTRGKVMVFFEPESECYGFVLSPKLSQATQLADVQFNAKYGTVGFESLVPTVARMLWDYGIEKEKVKLSVTEQRSSDMVWYKIERGR